MHHSLRRASTLLAGYVSFLLVFSVESDLFLVVILLFDMKLDLVVTFCANCVL